jgi:hypothetical protein
VIISLIFLILILGVIVSVDWRYEVYLKKQKAYLGFRKKEFLTKRSFFTYLASSIVFSIYLILGIFISLDEKQGLGFFWGIFFLLSIVSTYLLYDQYRRTYKKYFSAMKWFWLGGSGVASLISNFWISERVSSITRLPQGELPATDLLLSSTHFFVVLVLIFMLFNYIPVCYLYVRLVLSRVRDVRGFVNILCLLYIASLGPVMYFKTLDSEGFSAFFKDAIVFSSYSLQADVCEETESMNKKHTQIAFIRNGNISVAEYKNYDGEEYPDIIFTTSKCTIVMQAAN